MARRKTNKEFIQEVYELVRDEYEFLEEYVNSKTHLLCRHNKCGHEWKTRPDHFLSGRRCPDCAGKKKNKEFVQEIKELVGDEYEFLEEYVNNRTKILCRHNKCGHEWKVTPSNFIFGTRCNRCGNSSKGEKRIIKHLEKNNLKFEIDYSFKDLTVQSYLKFDFAVKQNGEILFLIEYDGKQHFKPSNHFHETSKDFGYAKYKDRVKSAYCINNNIPLLRIPYFKKHQTECLINKMLDKFNLFRKPLEKQKRMKIILQQSLKSTPNKQYKSMGKTYNSNIIPNKGDLIKDSVWKEPNEVIKIIINYSQNVCYVLLKPRNTFFPINEEVKIYKKHGWKEQHQKL